MNANPELIHGLLSRPSPARGGRIKEKNLETDRWAGERETQPVSGAGRQPEGRSARGTCPNRAHGGGPYQGRGEKSRGSA